MERKFLEGLGFDKDTVDKIMAEHGKGVEAQKRLTEAATADRDSYKSQLDGVAAKLKAFDGVDLDALRGEIDTLKGDLAKKETDFQSQLSERDFQAALTAEITAAKGKNPKAVMALLNMDTLKTSKNQKEDIAAALKALQESEAYLFDASKTDTTPAKVSTGGQHNEGGGTQTDTNALMNSALRGAVRGE